MPPRSQRLRSPSPRGASPIASPRSARGLPSARAGFFARHSNVYVYVPNLIGAQRIALLRNELRDLVQFRLAIPLPYLCACLSSGLPHHAAACTSAPSLR